MTGLFEKKLLARRVVTAILSAGLLLSGLVIGASPAKAVVNCDSTWTADSGSWYSAANWDNGVPTSSTDACIGGVSAKTITVDGGDAHMRVLTISNPAAVLRVKSSCCTDGFLNVNNAVDNAGTIEILGNSGMRASAPGALLTNNGTVSVPGGEGGQAKFELSIVNNGAITLARNTRTGGGATSLTNNGTFTVADGSRFEQFSPTTFTNAGTLATNTTGEYALNNNQIFNQAGTITGTLPVRFNGGQLRFAAGTSSSGKFLALGDTEITGNIDTGETITVSDNCCVEGILLATESLTNAGTIELRGNSRLRSTVSGNILTNSGTIETLAGSGTSRFELPIINDGTITVRQATRSEGAATSLTNNGTFTVADGVVFNQVSPTTFTNNGTLATNTTGEYVVNDNQIFNQAGTITGTLPIRNMGSKLRFTPSTPSSGKFLVYGTSEITGNIDANETITVSDNCCVGGSLVAMESFINAGTLAFNGDSTLGATVNGITVTNTGTIRGLSQSNGGKLDLPVTNNGVLQPGQGGGRITARAPLTLPSASTWDERITSTSNFDRLLVSGSTAAIGGEISISEQPASEPAPNTTLQIASGGTITGTFASVSQNLWPSGFGWTPEYGTNTVSLKFQNLVAPGAAAPAVPSITYANLAAVTISGACTSGEKVNARLRDSSTATNDVRVTGTCSDSAFTLSADSTSLADGAIDVSVTMTSPSGTATALPIATTTKDSTAPVGPDAPTASLTNPINAANAAAVHVTGACEAGNTLAITLTSNRGPGDATGTGICSGDDDYDATVDATDLADGEITALVTQTRSGLTSPASEPATATKDTVTPVAPGVILWPINAANESAALVSGSCESGARLAVTLTSTGAVPPSVSASDICDGDNTFAVNIDATSLDEGPVNASVVQTDTAGNPSPPGADSATKDSVAPNAPTVSFVTDPIDDTNDEAVLLEGTCETGTTVDVVVADSASGSFTMDDKACVDGAYSGTVNVSTLADGTITATPSQIDAAGNRSGNGTPDTAQKSTAPTETDGSIDITPEYINSSNQQAVPYTGTCVAGNRVDVQFKDGNGATIDVDQFTCAAAGTYGGTFNAGDFAQGPVTASAVQTDTSAHIADTDSAIKDTVGPDAATIDIAPAFINAATNLAAVPYSGTCGAGDDIRVLGGDEGHVSAPLGEEQAHSFHIRFTCPDTGTFSRTFNASAYKEGYVDVVAVPFDTAGNSGAGVADLVLKDTVKPIRPGAFTVNPSCPSDQTAPCVITSNGANSEKIVRVKGPCGTGDTMAITADDRHAETAQLTRTVACRASSYSVSLNLTTLMPGALKFTVSAVDPAGNASTPRELDVTKFQNAKINVTPTYINAANKSAVGFAGKCSTGVKVQVSLTIGAKQVLGPLLVCPSSHAFSGTLNASLLDDGLVTAKVSEFTPAGAPLGFSEDKVTMDTGVPVKPTVKLSPVGTTAQAAQMHVTGVCETGATVTVRVTKPSELAPKSVTCTNGKYDLSFNVRGFPKNSKIEAQATQTDKAGNKSPAGVGTVTKTV